MNLRKKVSSILLSAILCATLITPVNAKANDSIIGSNRFETAAKIADRVGHYDTAILVNGNSIADGLSASSLAGKENAPILLTQTNSIPQQTKSRLNSVKKVYLIGGENAISNNIEDYLNMSGKEVTRISGKNRIDTSLEVARVVGNYSSVFIVNGFKGEADAMSVASIAARDAAPIILTNGKNSRINFKNHVKYFAVGGSGVIDNNLVHQFNAERLAGSNRYQTNNEIIKRFYPNPSKIYFAKGNELVDALSVSLLAKDSGVVLVSENSNKDIFKNIEEVVQVGGMSDYIVNEISNITDIQEDIQKPEEDTQKPDKDDVQKPNQDDVNDLVTDSGKPYPGPIPVPPGDDEKVYDINGSNFRYGVMRNFYRRLDKHRADNGKPEIVHHQACEESTLMKSKHMIENDYFDHKPYLNYPNVSWIGECIAETYIGTDEKGRVSYNDQERLAEDLFQLWKNSPGHNKIMLKDSAKSLNALKNIDGFNFYAKEHSSFNGGKVYVVRATYHHATDKQLIGIDLYPIINLH